jgi:hypothetical protein
MVSKPESPSVVKQKPDSGQPLNRVSNHAPNSQRKISWYGRIEQAVWALALTLGGIWLVQQLNWLDTICNCNCIFCYTVISSFAASLGTGNCLWNTACADSTLYIVASV